ncbi:MAG: hypothetical protein WD972_03385 [Candidatus Andersenbacteria bacterium]
MLALVEIIVNGVLLIIAFVLAIIMLRAGATHQYNQGDNVIQDRMKWIILRCLVILIVIGIGASVFNLLSLL